MANAAEKLFATILPSLAPEQALDWTGNTGLAEDIGPSDPMPDTSNDTISSIDEFETGRSVAAALGQRSLAPPSREEGELIEGGVRHIGFDALAFYKSRRFLARGPFPGHWGIFYLRQSIAYIESQIADEYPGFGNPWKLAVEFLRQHERFHFQADLQTLLFEAVVKRPLYSPLRKALRGIHSHFVEESLANRQVWDWSQKPSAGIQEFAFDFLKLQPNAYAGFDRPPLELAGEWAFNTVDQQPPGTGARADLAHWVEATPKGLLRASLCPEYVIHTADLGAWISPTVVLPPVTEVEDGDELLKALKKKTNQDIKIGWKKTKKKFIEEPTRRGLNFKPWPDDGPDCYSVRVDHSIRAHLKHLSEGRWLAYKIGSHSQMGHG